MRNFAAGVMVGILAGAALAWGATATRPVTDTVLYLWTGEDKRPGLFYARPRGPVAEGPRVFYDCRRLGTVTITPPAP